MPTKRKSIFAIIIFVFFFGLITVSYYFIFKNKESFDVENFVICTQEKKLCPDGSSVSRTGPKCEFALCPKENLIRLFSPRAYEEISSPLLIKGEARGTWFFEGSFPVKLFDENNNLIAQHYATAKEDWMTENFVLFESNLIFEKPKTQNGWLVLKKDNPSDMRELDDELKIPVFFSQALAPVQNIKLYYYNPNLDKDETGNILCSRKGLVAVERKISLSKTPIQDTIKLLLEGKLTEEEKRSGITTEYPLDGFQLLGVNLKDGVLTLKFEDPYFKTSGGSCRTSILWFQIEATAKQFEPVKEVRFIPEDLFQS